MIKRFKVKVPFAKGSRRAYVYLPREAKRDPEKRFPVLYMFDGHNLFYDSDATYGKSWGLKEYMDFTDTPLIIAAAECNHEGNNRLCEYSPFDFSDRRLGFIEGRGEATMDWLINEFKPMIDGRFPTLTDRENTFIAGSSMGGLMSLYAVARFNHTFSRAACLSPSIWTSVKQVNDMIKDADMGKNTVIYMDYGEKEMSYRRNMKSGFKRTCGLLLEKNVMLTSRIVPNGEHNEASWEKQIPFFINTLLYR